MVSDYYEVLSSLKGIVNELAAKHFNEFTRIFLSVSHGYLDLMKNVGLKMKCTYPLFFIYRVLLYVASLVLV